MSAVAGSGIRTMSPRFGARSVDGDDQQPLPVAVGIVALRPLPTDVILGHGLHVSKSVRPQSLAPDVADARIERVHDVGSKASRFRTRLEGYPLPRRAAP